MSAHRLSGSENCRYVDVQAVQSVLILVATYGPHCHCGATKDLSYVPDPYNHEIINDDTDIWQCGSCEFDSAQEI